MTPLVGDRVAIALQPDGSGSLVEILPRRNAFQRPAVANLDQLVIIASGAVPVSDPFLLDRIISLAERKGCEPILCINKWDLVPASSCWRPIGPRESPPFRSARLLAWESTSCAACWRERSPLLLATPGW